MSVRIVPADTPRAMARFVDLPWRLYSDDPLWVPPLKRDVRLMFDRGKNPFFRHAEAQPFLAERGGRLVGRIAAIANEAHNTFHGDRAGFFGFFECEEDAGAAAALFDAAGEWVVARGKDALRGPMNFSTNDDCGSLIEGFDTPPMVLMPHNPPHHARLYEAARFRKEKDLLAYYLDDREVPERLARGVEAVRRRSGVTVRSLDLSRFEEEVGRVRAIYNSAWERNWGFVPMTREEMDHMARQLRPVVDPDLLLFAEAGGEPVAFALALPDMNEALRHANGRLFPLGALKIWWRARRIRRIRILTLGIRPEYRQAGVDVLLYHEIYVRAVRKGHVAAECSWILEDNLAMRRPLERMGARVYKVYRIYERPAGAAVAPRAAPAAQGAP